MSTNGLHLARQLLQFLEARTESQHQKLVEAANELIKNVIRQPGFSSMLLAWIHNSRGNAYRDLKEYQRTIQDFDRAIDLDPAYVAAYIHRSEAYRLMGNYGYALSDINYVLTLEEPIKVNIYNERGLILSHLGRYEEAIEEYERGLREESHDIYLLYNIAVVMARWKGITDAQLYIATAQDALLALNGIHLSEAKLYGLGGLAALVHQTDEALIYLRQAVLQNERVIGWARHDIAWIDLRNDPRFQAAITET